jgi:tripartite-type tricarboxylate transporter receptor subunit TctC
MRNACIAPVARCLDRLASRGRAGLIGLLVGVIGALALPSAQAQGASGWPSRPIKLIIPFPPGGATDIIGRAVAERLQIALGQNVVVENRAGASGNIGMGEAVRSPADGYTLVLGSAQTLTINPQLFGNLPFDPQKGLAPIVVVASVPNVLVVSKALPVRTPQDLVALAKERVGKLTYGSSSIGGSPHLSAELFKYMTGSFIVHVPYRGSAPALQDLLGGQIDLMFDNLPAALPQIRAGGIRAVAVTTLTRSAALPDVPTLDESGLKGFDSQGWFALLAPRGTPAPILDRLNAEVNKALAGPELRDRLQRAGADPVGGSIDAFQKRIQAETERWGKVIRFAGIKAE